MEEITAAADLGRLSRELQGLAAASVCLPQEADSGSSRCGPVRFL
ncbi:hypothetical protein [Paenibacillus donghaensis]|nr:hypothetical protein [Paenibacillus donghaensis]